VAKPLLYFVCTGNACRSQMAEGFARALAGDRWEVASGGLAPTRVDPRAIAAMAEAGIDISRQASKPVDPLLLARAAVVVTLCGEAEETCPATPPHVRRLHWPLPDPARATGTEAEVMAVFRTVREEIRRRVEALVAPPSGGSPRSSGRPT
jgi:arsenate reductase